MVRKVIILAIVASSLSALTDTTPAQAKACKQKAVSGLGNTKLTQISARASARLAWKSKVRARYGSRWDTWMRASGKRYVCTKAGVYDRCRAIAVPCRR